MAGETVVGFSNHGKQYGYIYIYVFLNEQAFNVPILQIIQFLKDAGCAVRGNF